MKEIIHFDPIQPAMYQEYINVGTKAYKQHYLHLWPQKDSSPYISTSFTTAVLNKEAFDPNTLLYVIRRGATPVGILKFTINASLAHHTKEDALYVDKIYILNEYSGMGIGKKALQFVALRAKELRKKIVWLDTMQKGPALNFYIKNGFQIFKEAEVQLPRVLDKEKYMYVMVKHLGD